MLIEPDDEASIFYSSGTTGKPKGALVTHRNICTAVGTNGFANARAFLRRGETSQSQIRNSGRHCS